MTGVILLVATLLASLAFVAWLDRRFTLADEAAMRYCAAIATDPRIPAQRDRRSELPPWLFDADPCAERWPDGGAVVEVGDVVPEDFA